MGKKSSSKATVNQLDESSSNAIIHIERLLPQPLAFVAPIVSFYNEKIRPILDALEKLRRLNIAEEGIQLPAIVVVGDQSSGKSSVLESLAGISLPRGQGICTRVPLVMRLQNHPIPQPELVLQYNGKTVSTDEADVSDAINRATEELAGPGKGISNFPLTLVVKKDGVPDLTMVDLPGITRVPVHGQPDNIYDQIKGIIMKYIMPEESIILNVLSATVDFTTCESIRMSQTVDKMRGRTLAVVTKVDMSPEGLLEKVTSDDVNIGLGYVCVRNRIGEESYEEARVEELKLFESHPLLSKIDKSMVGIPVLAQKLVHLQAMIISKTLPKIIKKIDEKLDNNLSELENLPANLSSFADAMSAFTHFVSSSIDSVKKILLLGDFEEYLEEKDMHCTARLVEKLNSHESDLQNCVESDVSKDFLMEEIVVLEEAKRIGLPNFIPRTTFHAILQRKVKGIECMPINVVDNVWNYLETVLISVIVNRHAAHYYQLQVSSRRAVKNLIDKKRKKCIEHVKEVVEMERLTDYTCNPEYLKVYNNLISYQGAFLNEVLDTFPRPTRVKLPEGVGEVDVVRLRGHHRQMLTEAFDLKARMVAYWKIVLRRLVDNIALHLMLSINELVKTDLEKEICYDLLSSSGGGIERLLEESPSITGKREKLSRSVNILMESKDTIANIMDRIGVYGD